MHKTKDENMAKDKGKKAKAEPVEETKPKKSKGGKSDSKPEKGSKKSKGGGKGDLMAPGTGGQFKAEDHVGELLLITPLKLEEDIATANGNANATRCNIVNLSAKKPEVIDDVLIFQKVVQGQLREALAAGGRVVGTLFVDNAAKKPGQSAPYKLEAPSSKDIDKARAYLDSLDPLR